MVGARLIGEFAWSIENLLNRVINKTLERTPDMMSMLREAVAAVPELVEQLETGRAPRVDVARIMAKANEIAGVRPAAPSESSAAAHAGATAAAAAPKSAPVLTSVVEPPAAAPEKKTTEAPIDPTLHEIYSKETAGHLAVIREYIAACEESAPPFVVTEDLHRSCHTLSGTAKTAGVRQGSKIADPLNRYIRKLYDNALGLTAEGLAALKEAASALQQVVDHINEDTGFFVDHDRIVARLQQLEHEIDAEIARLAESLDATTANPALSESVAQDVSAASPSDEAEGEIAAPQDAAAAATDASDAAFDAAGEEVIEIEPTDPNALEMLEWSFENFPEDDAPTVDVLLSEEPAAAPAGEAAGETGIRDELAAADEPPAEEVVEIDATDLTQEAQALHVSIEQAAPSDTVRRPALDVPELNIELASAEHDETESPTVTVPELGSALDLEPLLDQVVGSHADSDDVPTLDPVEQAVVEEHIELGGSLEDETDEVAEPAAVASDVAASLDEAPSIEVQEIELREEASSAPAEGAAPAEAAPSPEPASAPAAPPAAVANATAEDDDAIDPDFDPEVAAIFTEEATELLETADRALSDWIRDRGNAALAFELKRALHTLKGGARMAGIRAMGDLSHELESFMQLIENGQVPADQPVFDALQASLDELNQMRDAISQGERCKSARGLINRIRALAGLPVEAPAEPAPQGEARVEPAPSAPQTSAAATPSEQPQARDNEAAIDVEFAADELGAVAPRESVRVDDTRDEVASGHESAIELAARQPELPPDEPEEASASAEPTPPPVLPPGREPQTQERQEFARVDAELLDTLLNNAGEVSIFRSRLEQQVSSIEFNLAELGRTVTRLKEQLRKLELETEAQILHRHHEEHPDRADFDPLELDRYSTIQQLTRAFAESVSDVASIEGLLENLTREAQNLLLQQSRVVTELQNGLMRTRMVPFQRHVQRLTRLVRQVAADTRKRAELVVTGASGELDRQVLERMLPPFEHMLRNSVVHGIESPEERVAAGKPETGTIKVGLHREGSEMVIVLEDDGRGIDVKAVRERAIARGLVPADRHLSDDEALQLILEPGFSTASSVTQHAGRGVGMDVVVTEIKKLGGALHIETKAGQGTKFTIRLPFTLAITQALIVRTGDELYALPLPTVEGVARVPRSEVEKHLAEETPTFTYGGQVYRFQHLGAFVGGGPSVLPENDVAVPLLLIRAGEHSTALVTDELIGSREMVVKSVGPQIAGIRGIAGATILGDGRIVIILDMLTLVRSEWRKSAQLAPATKEDRRIFALVVDDSITVRRATQRLLERNGMRVMTAKDGVDAWSLLQEHVPDIILLDIEMPRMDGYELATHVRADPRLADIPIVMITSRVGEKHRARAIEIGVNDYLGKPYQEHQLLDAIEPLVEARRRRVS